MSANNEILIHKNSKRKFIIKHFDLDTGIIKHDKFPECSSLEEAVKLANEFMKEIEVEYGLRIII